MDHFISMYIDNELSLDEKIMFVEHCADNRHYTDEAVSLLKQEKQLNAALNRPAPEVELPFSVHRGKLLHFPIHSLGWAIAACLLLLFTFYFTYDNFSQPQQNIASRTSAAPVSFPHRFVIHQQETQQVEITGSFTDWQRIPLDPTGTNGYWEVYMDLPEGEHRYTFIINGSTYLPDPTVPQQESDDFGSKNSILKIKA